MRRKRPVPPSHPPVRHRPRGLYELDRFSAENLSKWKAASDDLDELERTLHYGTEPGRLRYRADLLGALALVEPLSLDLDGWCRIVQLRWTNAPLSAAGSLTGIGGRFNAGMDIGGFGATHRALPSLYLASDHETAYAEVYGIRPHEQRNGLSGHELALRPVSSHTCVVVKGELHAVFDLTKKSNLAGVLKVLRRIKLPQKATDLRKRLRITGRYGTMVSTIQELYEMLVVHNWRTQPSQFELPAGSQVMGELIRAAGFEAIVFPSSVGNGRCLSIFPERLRQGSFIQLRDAHPDSVSHPRLDAATSVELDGARDFGLPPFS